MASWSLVDYVLNVCRSVSDVLHIMVYLFVVIIAIIIAIYKYDKDTYTEYVVSPIIKFLLKVNLLKIIKTTTSRKFRTTKHQLAWSVGSNRLPYIMKIIKNFFNK